MLLPGPGQELEPVSTTYTHTHTQLPCSLMQRALGWRAEDPLRNGGFVFFVLSAADVVMFDLP